MEITLSLIFQNFQFKHIEAACAPGVYINIYMYTCILYIHTHHLNHTTLRRFHYGSINYPSADSLAIAMGSGCLGNRKQHIDTYRFI